MNHPLADIIMGQAGELRRHRLARTASFAHLIAPTRAARPAQAVARPAASVVRSAPVARPAAAPVPVRRPAAAPAPTFAHLRGANFSGDAAVAAPVSRDRDIQAFWDRVIGAMTEGRPPLATGATQALWDRVLAKAGPLRRG